MKPFRFSAVVSVALLLTFFATNIQAWQDEVDAELRMQLQAELDEIVERNRIPGATLGVTFKDGRQLTLASGMADRESSQAMEPDSQMLCGSTGKTFVSAVALQLVAEGKINLDDLASKYFSEGEDKELFAKLPNSDAITVRSLMNHTSGLPRYLFQDDYLADLKANPFKKRTPREGLEALHGVEPIHPVGEGWAYSDSNYLVVGLIIEKVTGTTYYENAKKRLLDPLGLTLTYPATQPELPGLVPGYIGSNNFFELPLKTVSKGKYAMDPVFEWCGGGFVTNAGDLSKCLHALHSGKVLDPKLHDQLIAPVDFRTGKPAEQGYGLGSFVWKTDNGMYFGHAGVMPGYLTHIEYSQDDEFAIALQTNTDEGNMVTMHRHVQAIANLIVQGM